MPNVPISTANELDQNETVLFEAHQHTLILILRLFRGILESSLLILAAFGTISLFSLEPVWPFVIAGLLILINFAVRLIPWLKTTFSISHQRVIIREQNGLIEHNIYTSNLDKIRETAVSIQGLGSIFHYGQLIIMSDLELSRKQLNFKNTPSANEVKIYLDKIVNLVKESTPKDKLPAFVDKDLN